jgi:uncharacterized protein (UPF0332 family)
MKPQTEAFLEKANELLAQAQTMVDVGLTEAAGRTAYLAGFHAAQALIFETHDRVFKKHSSVQGEFARLVRDDPRFDSNLRAFLGRAYSLKSIADYETGEDAHVSHEHAVAALTDAVHFVETLVACLSESA